MHTDKLGGKHLREMIAGPSLIVEANLPHAQARRLFLHYLERHVF